MREEKSFSRRRKENREKFLQISISGKRKTEGEEEFRCLSEQVNSVPLNFLYLQFNSIKFATVDFNLRF